MKLNWLEYTKGSRHSKKRIGRGTSSGTGKTSSRGHKGQNSRTGGGVRPGFEGGQTPIIRRIPKIGFNNFTTKKYVLINLDNLERLKLNEINHEILVAKKILKNKKELIKILGKGSITKSINVKVNKISHTAKTAIEKLGGKVEVI